MRVGPGDRGEIDVVDGELAVPVDEVDVALARSADAGDEQLHGGGAGGQVPGAERHGLSVGLAGIADAEGHRPQAGDRLSGIDGAHHAGMGVDHEVHGTLAIEQDLARPVPGHRAKSHPVEEGAEDQRLGRRELEELEAGQPQGVARRGMPLGDRHAPDDSTRPVREQSCDYRPACRWPGRTSSTGWCEVWP
jgi:hypothetical protein